MSTRRISFLLLVVWLIAITVYVVIVQPDGQNTNLLVGAFISTVGLATGYFFNNEKKEETK
jgi:hypothetical protein